MLGSLQDLVVTLVAAVAATVVLQRVLGFARARRPAPKCAGCEPGLGAHGATGSEAGRRPTPSLVVVRPPRP